MTHKKLSILLLLLPAVLLASESESPQRIEYPEYPAAPEKQSQQTAVLKSFGCVSCHTSNRRQQHARQPVRRSGLHRLPWRQLVGP